MRLVSDKLSRRLEVGPRAGIGLGNPFARGCAGIGGSGDILGGKGRSLSREGRRLSIEGRPPSCDGLPTPSLPGAIPARPAAP